LVNGALEGAWAKAMAGSGSDHDQAARLAAILRDTLRETLDLDLQRRLERPGGQPVYTHGWERKGGGTTLDADLNTIRDARKVGDRLVIGHEPANEPHQLDVAFALVLQPARRADLV
jgi:hypothetical protein